MNDTYGCFYRIEHIAAIFVLIHFGLAYSDVTTLFSILQKTIEKIVTGYGVSKSVNTGIGQGNGLGPSLWCQISSFIV